MIQISYWCPMRHCHDHSNAICLISVHQREKQILLKMVLAAWWCWWWCISSMACSSTCEDHSCERMKDLHDCRRDAHAVPHVRKLSFWPIKHIAKKTQAPLWTAASAAAARAKVISAAAAAASPPCVQFARNVHCSRLRSCTVRSVKSYRTMKCSLLLRVVVHCSSKSAW